MDPVLFKSSARDLAPQIAKLGRAAILAGPFTSRRETGTVGAGSPEGLRIRQAAEGWGMETLRKWVGLGVCKAAAGKVPERKSTTMLLAARLRPNLGWKLCRNLSCSRDTSEKKKSDIGKYLGDPESAIRGKTSWEVFRGWLVFKILSYDLVVDNSTKLYQVSKRFLGVWLTEKIMRLTVFGQFVSGLDEKESQVTAKKWAEQGITSIWYRSVERDLEEIQAPQNDKELNEQEVFHDAVAEAYLKSIELAGVHNHTRDPKFMSFKVTAIVNPVLLNKLNAVLVAAEETFLSHATSGKHKIDRYIPTGVLQKKLPAIQLKEQHEKERVSLVDWNKHFCYINHLDHFSQLQVPSGESIAFTDLERDQIGRWIRRLQQLGEATESYDVSVLVDAEQRYFQKAIEHFTLHLFFKHFNGGSSCPRFYNTVQTYLTDSFDTLLINEATARSYGVKLAVKIVRGCYLEHERQFAASIGAKSPIHPSKPRTDSSYHYCLEHAMKWVHDHNSSVFVASHNKETVHRALELMNQYNIPASDSRVSFGQQMGMADHLTLPLAQAGYHACKLVPYGSLDDIVPFLSRRANENRGIMRNAQDERNLYFREMRRHLLPSS